MSAVSVPPDVRFVGAVHDSLLFEMDTDVVAPRYHWIEEGTFEDFKRNILESDLPVPLAIFDFASTGFALMGAHTGRLAMNAPVVNPCAEIVIPDAQFALMGTHTAVNFWVGVDMAKAEDTTIAMLLARPEMQHEPQAAKA